MKKILVISMDMGFTAPGIVFKTLLEKLTVKDADFTVLCPRVDRDSLPENSELICESYRFHSWRTNKKWWRILGFNIYDAIWTARVKRKYTARLESCNFDYIISFVSNGYYASLDAGHAFSAILGKPWVVYSVDGLPSPEEWFEDNLSIRRNIITHLRKVTETVDLWFASNEFMMKYQQSVLPDNARCWDYLYTPYTKLSESFFQKPHNGFNIVYMGTLYGLRKIDSLLEAFRIFLQHRPDARLLFYGCYISSDILQANRDLVDNGSLVLEDFTTDVETVYSTADVLLDVAAYISGDVYLSSKIICYLPVPIPIVAISGPDSVAERVMTGIPSIHHCHNRDEIYQAFVQCEDNQGIADRSELLHEFSPETIAEKFASRLNL